MVTAVNMGKAGDGDVEALRARLDARTDMELAATLGVQRSAIAHWRSRGVPSRYRFLVRQRADSEVAGVIEQVAADEVLGDARHRYWLRAALALLPATYFGSTGDLQEDAIIREKALLRLMLHASTKNLTVLGKVACDSDADFAILLASLETEREVLQSHLLISVPPPGPQ